MGNETTQKPNRRRIVFRAVNTMLESHGFWGGRYGRWCRRGAQAGVSQKIQLDLGPPGLMCTVYLSIYHDALSRALTLLSGTVLASPINGRLWVAETMAAPRPGGEDRLTWRFEWESLDSDIEIFLRDLEVAGIPWLDAHSELPAFLEQYPVDTVDDLWTHAVLAVGWWLAGDRARMESTIRAGLRINRASPGWTLGGAERLDYPGLVERLRERAPMDESIASAASYWEVTA